jgi:hypothetical protein
MYFGSMPFAIHELVYRAVEAASVRPQGIKLPTAVPCRRRKCNGYLTVLTLDDTIEWCCAECDDSGSISSWKGGDSDLSEFADDDLDKPRVEALLSPYEYAYINLPCGATLHAPRLVASAVYERGRIVLRGSSNEFGNLKTGIEEDLPNIKGQKKRILNDLIGYLSLLEVVQQ